MLPALLPVPVPALPPLLPPVLLPLVAMPDEAVLAREDGEALPEPPLVPVAPEPAADDWLARFARQVSNSSANLP